MDTNDNGLEGMIAAAASLSDVDGERGEPTLAGHLPDELAGRTCFEACTRLLRHAELPAAETTPRGRLIRPLSRYVGPRGRTWQATA